MVSPRGSHAAERPRPRLSQAHFRPRAVPSIVSALLLLLSTSLYSMYTGKPPFILPELAEIKN